MLKSRRELAQKSISQMALRQALERYFLEPSQDNRLVFEQLLSEYLTVYREQKKMTKYKAFRKCSWRDIILDEQEIDPLEHLSQEEWEGKTPTEQNNFLQLLAVDAVIYADGWQDPEEEIYWEEVEK